MFPARAPEFETELTMEQQLLGIEPGEGRHAGSQAGFQLALLFSSIFIAILGGLLTGTHSLTAFPSAILNAWHSVYVDNVGKWLSRLV